MKICYQNVTFFIIIIIISEKAREKKFFLALASYGFSVSTDSVQLI